LIKFYQKPSLPWLQCAIVCWLDRRRWCRWITRRWWPHVISWPVNVAA